MPNFGGFPSDPMAGVQQYLQYLQGRGQGQANPVGTPPGGGFPGPSGPGGGTGGWGASMMQAAFSPFGAPVPNDPAAVAGGASPYASGGFSASPSWAGATGWPGSAAVGGGTIPYAPPMGGGAPGGAGAAGAAPGAGGGAPGSGYGVGRGGPTGANIPAPGGVPGSTTGYTNPLGQAFEDPQAAVWNALKNMGVNVYSSNPVIQSVLGKANDLITQNVLPAIASGSVSPLDASGIGNLVQGAVQKFITNQPVFYGAGLGGAGRSILDQLIALGGQGGGGTEGGQFVASLLDNPQSAAALGQSLLVGGAAPTTAAKVLGAPIRSLPAEQQRQQYYTPGGLPLPGQQGYLSILDQYLRGQLQPFTGQ